MHCKKISSYLYLVNPHLSLYSLIVVSHINLVAEMRLGDELILFFYSANILTCFMSNVFRAKIAFVLSVLNEI